MAPFDLNTPHSSALHHPWQIIPSELWSTIFKHCIDTHPLYYRLPAQELIRDSRLIPMVLASVCRAWRWVACNTAELWSACWVSFAHPELNTLWLGRAGVLKLHLYGRYSEKFPVNWDAVFGSILPFQKRWQSLELDAGDWRPPEFVPEFETHALEIFKLSISSETPIWVPRMLSKASQLHELQLRAQFDTFGLSLPYLTSLTIGFSTPAWILRTLSKFPKLLHLTTVCRSSGSTWSFVPPPVIVTHTSLIELHLVNPYPGDLIALNASLLLENLTLPSLRILNMAYEFDCSTFLRFLHRSGCHLTELHLASRGVQDEEIMTILQESSVQFWMEKLEIRGLSSRVIPVLFDLLSGQYFPHLNSLSLHDCGFSHVRDGALADIIIPRSRPHRCDCRNCLLQQEKVVQLECVSIHAMGRMDHILDIARLSVLPGDLGIGTGSMEIALMFTDEGKCFSRVDLSSLHRREANSYDEEADISPDSDSDSDSVPISYRGIDSASEFDSYNEAPILDTPSE